MGDVYLYPLTEVGREPKEIGKQPERQVPEMWICSDTYWTWSRDRGVEYHKDGVPEGYD